MNSTYTMNKIPIPFWIYSKWICYLANHLPHRVEDFAKSFSENQVYSKSWLVEQMMMNNDICSIKNKDIWILGSWYGTILIPLLTKNISDIKTIHLVDYDEETLEIASGVFKQYNIRTHKYDINFDYPKIKGDIIINTSCEHMWPMKDYDFNGICVFQSNNFKDDAAHINCVESLDEFVLQSGLNDIMYKGEIDFHKYDDYHKRYMVIGKK